MKTFFVRLCIGFCLVYLSSCVKQNDLVVTPEKNASFENTVTPDDFNWSTAKTIQLQFKGSAENKYQLVLKVALEDGTVIYQKAQPSTENAEVSLEIPSNEKSLTISYGKLSKSVDCTGSSASFAVTE